MGGDDFCGALWVWVTLSVSADKGKHLFSQFNVVWAVGECIWTLTAYFSLLLVAVNWARLVQFTSCWCEWFLSSWILGCIGSHLAFSFFFFRRVYAAEAWWAFAKCVFDLDSFPLLAVHCQVQLPGLPWNPSCFRVTGTCELYISGITSPDHCVALTLSLFSSPLSSATFLPSSFFLPRYFLTILSMLLFRECWLWTWLAFFFFFSLSFCVLSLSNHILSNIYRFVNFQYQGHSWAPDLHTQVL